LNTTKKITYGTLTRDLRWWTLGALTSLLACSGPGDDGAQGTGDAITIKKDTAQFLLEGYMSGSPDTGVDEWDVALVPRDGRQFLVARGYKDAVGSDGALDPSQRTAVIDIVRAADGSSKPSFEVPDTDAPKQVDGKTYPALMDDFHAMSLAASYQAKVASSTAAGGGASAKSLAGLHFMSAGSGSLVAACGSGSKAAAGILSKIESFFSSSSAPAEPSGTETGANNGTLDNAQHVCPVQTNAIQASGAADGLSDIQMLLGGARNVGRFFERNRRALGAAIRGDRQQFAGLLRCLFGDVVTGIYLFGETGVPSEGVADYIASKGVSLPDALLPQAMSLAPALAGAAELEVGAWGGLDISDGVTSPDLFGGFNINVEKGFHIPLIGHMYISEGIVVGYDFTSQEWTEPEWETSAGDIPLSIGAIEAGLGGFVTGGDAVGFTVAFDVADGAATWGIVVELSKTGVQAFWTAAMSGDFVNGCRSGDADKASGGDHEGS
jgi:hypothetical protein